MLLIALTAAMAAMLGQHLGIADKLSELTVEVAKCPKCTTFWVTLIVLVLYGYDFIAGVALSLLMAYLSYWFGIILILMQKLYNILWEKANKKL